MNGSLFLDEMTPFPFLSLQNQVSCQMTEAFFVPHFLARPPVNIFLKVCVNCRQFPLASVNFHPGLWKFRRQFPLRSHQLANGHFANGHFANGYFENL